MTTGTPLPSYGKVWALGHRSVAGIFDRPVLLQEKIDGSQLTFGVRGQILYIRSKGAAVDPEDPGMFLEAVVSLENRKQWLTEGLTYRGEFLRKPKHNVLAYDRVPEGNIAIFDVQDREGQFHGPDAVSAFARNAQLEAVRVLDAHANVGTAEELKEWLRETSQLGGPLIEGVVVKRYDRQTQFGDPYFGKYVSEAFKESHSKEWKGSRAQKEGALDEIIQRYCTPARFEKAVQHLRESGALQQDPKDIGLLMKEVSRDVLDECRPEISEALFDVFWKSHFARGITRGLPEWYKDKLLEGAFA